MKKIIILLLCFVGATSVFAQQLTGSVMEYGEDEKKTPVVGALLQWKNTNIGTVTDISGAFSLPKTKETDTLIVIYQAYQNDTIAIKKDQTELKVILS
ncbi:MAG: carboxypeptidase-like regulatory domain-containing protein, partial [Bacteroidales bacterium]